jgi:hypothetical protein
VRGDFACVAGVFAKSDEIVGVHARCVNAPWKWACALIRGGGANARGNGTMDARCPNAHRPSAVRLEVAVRDHPDAKMGPRAR